MNDEERHVTTEAPLSGFGRLYEIIVKLRSENGCAWDKKQTSRTLLPNLIEEVYELYEAIEEEDHEHIKEELGDLFLLVTMISYINEQSGNFNTEDVFKEISEKLIRRHPHVFGENNLSDPDGIIKQWNQIKRDIEGRDNTEYITDSIPSTLPPLEKSLKIQKKVSEYGFDWEDIEQVIEKLEEEIGELKQELYKSDDIKDKKMIEREIGDILFASVNISRFLKIDPGLALNSTNKKFINRFRYVQDKLKENDMELAVENITAMEHHWNRSKTEYP